MVEFSGILEVPGETYFAIRDGHSHKFIAWVTLNQSGHDFIVRDFDRKHGAISVEQFGRTTTLYLSAGGIASSARDDSDTEPASLLTRTSPALESDPATLEKSQQERWQQVKAIVDRQRARLRDHVPTYADAPQS